MEQADIQKMANDGKLYALAYATLDLYKRVTSTPEGREMIERQKRRTSCGWEDLMVSARW